MNLPLPGEIVPTGAAGGEMGEVLFVYGGDIEPGEVMGMALILAPGYQHVLTFFRNDGTREEWQRLSHLEDACTEFGFVVRNNLRGVPMSQYQTLS